MNIATIVGGSLAAVLLVSQAGLAESFDKPLHKTVLDLGRSTNLMKNDNRHVTVTCWYYKHFMIKEQDDPGLKGAILITLASVQPGHIPQCLQALQPSEKKFTEWSEEYKKFVPWNGYFAGVKHDLIFLEWPDGDDNSGIPFTAFETDAKTKFFEDSVMLEVRGERHLNFIPTSDQSDRPSLPKSGECWMFHPKIWRDLLEQAAATNGSVSLASAKMHRLRGQTSRSCCLRNCLSGRSHSVPQAFHPSTRRTGQMLSPRVTSSSAGLVLPMAAAPNYGVVLYHRRPETAPISEFLIENQKLSHLL